MKKYKVSVYVNNREPEIIEAEDRIEAEEEMFNMIMDSVDLYLDIVAEEIEKVSDSND